MPRSFRTAPTAQRRAGLWPAAVWATLALACGGPAVAQDDAHNLAKPIADLASLPNQDNGLKCFQPNNGHVAGTSIRPVTPFSDSEDRTVISRTIVSALDAHRIGAEPGSSYGIDNTARSYFFSPKKPTDFGLMQNGHRTFGALRNHIWSVNSGQEYGARGTTLFQPFAPCIKKDGTTFTIKFQATYVWEGDEWTVPLTAAAYKPVKVGNQRIPIGGGPEGSPEGWGPRVQATPLFPKRGGRATPQVPLGGAPEDSLRQSREEAADA